MNTNRTSSPPPPFPILPLHYPYPPPSFTSHPSFTLPSLPPLSGVNTNRTSSHPPVADASLTQFLAPYYVMLFKDNSQPPPLALSGNKYSHTPYQCTLTYTLSYTPSHTPLPPLLSPAALFLSPSPHLFPLHPPPSTPPSSASPPHPSHTPLHLQVFSTKINVLSSYPGGPGPVQPSLIAGDRPPFPSHDTIYVPPHISSHTH